MSKTVKEIAIVIQLGNAQMLVYADEIHYDVNTLFLYNGGNQVTSIDLIEFDFKFYMSSKDLLFYTVNEKITKATEENIFGSEISNESKHSIKGLTNELEDVTEDQIADIKAKIKSKLNKEISERNINLDARRIFLNRTTVNKVIQMYDAEF